MAAQYQALQVPPPGSEKGGVEVLRVAIIEAQLHLTLRRSFDDPAGWGQLLADVAQHAAHVYAEDSPNGRAQALAAISTQFAAALHEHDRVSQTTQLP